MGMFGDIRYEIRLLLEPSDRLGERLIEEKVAPILTEINATFLDVWLRYMEERARFAKG